MPDAPARVTVATSEELTLPKVGNRRSRQCRPSRPVPRRYTYTSPPPRETGIMRKGHLPDDENAWQNAVVLIDKPLEFTSFDVCAKLRGALSIKKVGHAGTLDPMATGLLIICVGGATKRVNDYMAMAKEYTGTIRLGQGTPSFDVESEVSEQQPWEHVTDEALSEVAAGFLGDSQQLPPMFSAIRVKGQRLYRAAREGREVAREPRAIHISAFEVERSAPDCQDVSFQVTCSKGTYVRSIANDLGIRLGTVAHLVGLRRTAIGDVSIRDAWPLDELVQAVNSRRWGSGDHYANTSAHAATPVHAGESDYQQAGAAAATSILDKEIFHDLHFLSHKIPVSAAVEASV
ncbi:hypothetical protein WJX84_005917 [Apatococcus fuscideae]|uniref:tRNA pseudouridine(55) synthase n=1 Tax=Apatococcus fuscideae TaxID=2026836 RepID=A0AAW1TD95_9CHLO